MDTITYYIIKDEQIISSNSCPMMVFNTIVQLIFENTYDYIQIEHNGNVYTFKKWDYSYHENQEFTESEHNELLGRTWFCKFTPNT